MLLSNFKRCITKETAVLKNPPNISLITSTQIGKKESRAERNPVKNGCTEMCEDLLRPLAGQPKA